MSMNVVTLLYLIASICFIQALKGLSNPKTARLGNTFGMAGMAIAILTTIALIVKQASALGSNLGLGLGLLFLHFYTAYAAQATALLFGNVLGVDTHTLWLLLALSLLSLLALALMARPLLFASLQPELAEARGVSLRLMAVLFMIVVAVATAECAQIVGVLLVFALMVGPPATAQRLTARFGRGVLLSVLIAVAQAWGGLVLAFYTDWPVSFWITALGALAYVAAHLGQGRWRSSHP